MNDQIIISPKMVIGLVGEQWSGKDTAAKLIQNLALPKKVEIIKFSAILSKTLDIWGIPSSSRENRRKIYEAMEEKFGKQGSPLANIIKQQIQKSEASAVVLNSIKSYNDVKIVRQFSNNIIIYITASFDIRYLRCQQAKNQPIDYYGKSYDEFAIEENDPGELFVTQIGREQANEVIQNDGTMEEFIEKVKKLYIEKIAPIIF